MLDIFKLSLVCTTKYEQRKSIAALKKIRQQDTSSKRDATTRKCETILQVIMDRENHTTPTRIKLWLSERNDKQQTVIMRPLNFRFCKISSTFHSSNNIFYVYNFVKQTLLQKCTSQDCTSKNSIQLKLTSLETFVLSKLLMI